MVKLLPISKNNLTKTYPLGSTVINTDDNEVYYHNGESFNKVIALNSSENLGIGTENSGSTRVEISDIDGNCMRLSYDQGIGVDSTSYADLSTTYYGDLLVNPSNGNLNILTHDGSTKGLQLNSVLVTSSANQLNYLNVAKGTATANKAVVLDSSSSIHGINMLTTTNKVGINTSTPYSQLEINSSDGDCLRLTYNDSDGTATYYTDFTVDSNGYLYINPSGKQIILNAGSSLNLVDHNGIDTGLKLNGSLVLATANQLNYTNTTPGTAASNKAVILNASMNINGINNINTIGKIGINTSAPDRQLEVNSVTGECLRLTYADNNGTATYYSDFDITNLGELIITSSGNLVKINAGNSLDITSHNGLTTGLKLDNVLVTATANQLNYTNVTPGTAAASKALVLNSSLDIAGIRNFTITNKMGINTTAPDRQLEINNSLGECLRLTFNDNNGTATNYSDINVSSIGELLLTSSANIIKIDVNNSLNIVSHNGIDIGLKLDGILVLSSATQLNYNNVLPGTASPK